VKSDITKPVKPTFDFLDTGLSDNDGITNNGVVAVYIVVDVAVLSILTSTVVELVNSDFVVSMTIDEVSLYDYYQ
jgi:hypothetical protein